MDDKSIEDDLFWTKFIFLFFLLLFVHFSLSLSFNLCLWGFVFFLSSMFRKKNRRRKFVVSWYNHDLISHNLQLLDFSIRVTGVVVVVVVFFRYVQKGTKNERERKEKMEEGENKSNEWNILHLTFRIQWECFVFDNDKWIFNRFSRDHFRFKMARRTIEIISKSSDHLSHSFTCFF